MEEAEAGGGETMIQIRTEMPVVAGPGDRFILRALSPVRTVGGGRILEAMAQRLRGTHGQTVEYARRLAEAQKEDASFASFAVASARSGAARTNDVSIFIKQTPENTRRLLTQLAEEGQIVRLTEDLYIHAERLSALEAVLTAELEGFHRERPELPGMETGFLMERLGVDKGVFDALLAYWRGGASVMRLERLRCRSHSETCDPALAGRSRSLRGIS
jgi:selenocysteine-specific elongation factor